MESLMYSDCITVHDIYKYNVAYSVKCTEQYRPRSANDRDFY